MKTITVREFARLTTDEIRDPSLDWASLSPADFDILCALNERRREGEPPLLRMIGRRTLQVCNYVGVIQTSLGTRIEILPKTTDGSSSECIDQERNLLIKILSAVFNLTYREGETANIRRFTAPLQEWVISRFLEELHFLFKKGLRLSYNHVAEERPFLRGRLDVGRQVVQPPQRMHLLHIRHNIYSVDRPEHRLLKSALDRCIATTQDGENIRLATPLHELFSEIQPSFCQRDDFRQWSDSRHMAHYQRIRPWCELVLGTEMPFALAGEWHGISMLFPMEKLFEKYVGVCLRQQLVSGARLYEQVSRNWLCTHCQRSLFSLRPDILINYKEKDWLLDVKWKKLSGDRSNSFGISQHDFYQLFAYGHKYLKGEGDLALIYPMHNGFPPISEPFVFSDALRLWVLPFDLETDRVKFGTSTPYFDKIFNLEVAKNG